MTAEQKLQLDDIKEFINARFDKQDEKIDALFDKQEERIDARFDKQDERINARFDKQDEKIDARFNKQDEKISDLKIELAEIKVDTTWIKWLFGGLLSFILILLSVIITVIFKLVS